jgi:hypothetical protein
MDGSDLSRWPTHYLSYREIAFRDFGVSDALVHGSRETPIPDSPIRAVINGPEHFLSNGCDYIEITYRDFGIFVVIVHGTRETPILDSPMKRINGPDLHACFNDCDQVAKSHIAISEFSLSNELDISKS